MERAEGAPRAPATSARQRPRERSWTGEGRRSPRAAPPQARGAASRRRSTRSRGSSSSSGNAVRAEGPPGGRFSSSWRRTWAGVCPTRRGHCQSGPRDGAERCPAPVRCFFFTAQSSVAHTTLRAAAEGAGPGAARAGPARYRHHGPQERSIRGGARRRRGRWRRRGGLLVVAAADGVACRRCSSCARAVRQHAALLLLAALIRTKQEACGCGHSDDNTIGAFTMLSRSVGATTAALPPCLPQHAAEDEEATPLPVVC